MDKKIIPSVLSVVLLALFIGGSAFHSYQKGDWVTLDGLMSESIERARTNTSARFDASFNLDFSEFSQGNFPVPIPAEGSLNMKGLVSVSGAEKNLENLKMSAVISALIGPLDIEIESRLVNKTQYIKLTKLPAFGMPPELSSFKDKWFSSPFELKEEDKILLFYENPESEEAFSKILQDAHLAKDAKRLPLETVNGEPSYHFSFDIDREGVISYLKSIDEYERTASEEMAALPPLDADRLKELFDGIKDFRGEIWIGKNDKLFRKLKVGFAVQPEADKEERAKIDVVFEMYDYNKPVSVVAPESSVPMEEFMADYKAKMGMDSVSPNLP